VFSPACVESTIKNCLCLDYRELFELEKSLHALVQDRFEYKVVPENAEYMIPKLALLLLVTMKADVSRLQHVQTNGNCNALLTNAQLWEDQEGSGGSKSHRVSISSKAKPPLLTVNWHLEKDCNYKCSFCYAHFDHVIKNLDLQEGFKLIKALRKEGNFYKINFVCWR